MAPRTPYRTRQQALIVEYLAGLEGRHITVAQLEAGLRRRATPIAKATLYRHLERLEQGGLVRRYTLNHAGGVCYQYLPEAGPCKEHLHLKCGSCGELIHLDCDQLDDLQQHLQSRHGFAIDTSKTVLVGTCQGCLPKHTAPKGEG